MPVSRFRTAWSCCPSRRSRRTANVAAAASVAIAMCAFTASRADAAGLLGAEVTYAGYCCTAPILPDLVTNMPTAIVGPGIEFPLGSILTNGVFPLIVSQSDDVSANSITLSYPVTERTLGGTFNGAVFTFSGPSVPAITGATVDP